VVNIGRIRSRPVMPDKLLTEFANELSTCYERQYMAAIELIKTVLGVDEVDDTGTSC